ncbi:MAG: RNA-binding protein [Planctomycetaceae bacterium]|nr:RNA-binding protein [Planctomycetaceae bacterium]
MSVNLYVGNLPYKTTSDDLKDAFSQYGEVTRAAVIMDRETGRSRGYGFVEMETGGKEAIAAMDGFEMEGRNLKVNEARPRQPRSH